MGHRGRVTWFAEDGGEPGPNQQFPESGDSRVMSAVDGIPALHIKTKLKSTQEQLLDAGKIQILQGWRLTVDLLIPSQPVPRGTGKE